MLCQIAGVGEMNPGIVERESHSGSQHADQQIKKDSHQRGDRKDNPRINAPVR
jgi:hypothetical protein